MIGKELQRLLSLENSCNLDSIKVDEIPIWRIVRFSTRLKYLKKKGVFTNSSIKKVFKIKEFLFNYWHSRKQIKKLIRSNKNVRNIVFAFPRLIKVEDDVFIDRFTDPIIEQTSIRNDYIIFQKNFIRKKLTPRLNCENVIYTDYIDWKATFYSILFLHKVYFKYRIEIISLLNKAGNIYEFNRKDKFFLILKISHFINTKNLYEDIFKHLKPSNVLTVNREVYLPVVACSNEMGIKTFEIQHGITFNDTVLYSGIYNKITDPDYFLAFGENSQPKWFYIPKNKLVNIGFAFIPYLRNKKLTSSSDNNNKIIIVSTPNITHKLLLLIEKAVRSLTMYSFVIRLHPQEELNHEQSEIIEKYDNLTLDDNTIDSFISLMNCDKVIGDKSTVLFEALSLNKPVAKLNFKDFINPYQKGSGFSYVNSFDELVDFIKSDNLHVNADTTYSNFKPTILNEMLK